MEIKEYVAIEKTKLRLIVSSLKIVPHLVIIQANDDEGSNIYIRGKVNDCREVGFLITLVKLDVNISQIELIKKIKSFNEDPSVHGVIVQMPLPKHIDENIIKQTVDPKKDVDGFHPLSKLTACTPKGIIDYLTFSGFEFMGKNAVVIGRSNIVGRPLAKLLIDQSCNVTVLHSKTSKIDMEFYLSHADLICLGVGKMHFLSTQKLKPSAWVVDIGITRIDGVVYGDAIPGLKVALQTPVPGGVGLLTRLTLLKNLLEAYNRGI